MNGETDPSSIAGRGSGEATAIKRALLAVRTLQAKLDAVEHAGREPIAVVGLGCRFPQASGPDELWRLLDGGVDAVAEVPPQRWDVAAFYDPDPDAPGKMSSRFGAFLGDVSQFDAGFFGISAREAAAMDPQQRLLLEVVWEALEHAGQAPDRLLGTRGAVFLGVSTADYLHLQNTAGLAAISGFSGTGNAFSTAAGRISYLLGLEGPSLAVDTACSSSLVCVHLACQSLRARECDLALAAGVNLMLSPGTSIAVSKYHALSPDGRCKAFDAAANGFVRGEGCGVVVLKRLSDALANQDRVLALIRGTAVNQDGRSSGMTAPNVLAQQAVIGEALRRGGVSVEDVGYVEAHGTGTSLGDPIEMSALAETYGRPRPGGGRCAVGSIKTNIGHLEAAAGIAGLMKVVLALGHQQIPAHLHLRTLNPRISLDGSCLFVPTEGRPWPRGEKPRLGAVSSFGISGTNAHAVLEEAPAPASPDDGSAERAAHVFTLSARTATGLRALVERHERLLAGGAVDSIADLCFTVNTGRARWEHRLALVARDLPDLGAQLAAVRQGTAPAGRQRGGVARRTRPRVAFLFTGQGAQYAGMGRQLYDSEPVFRRAFDRCAEIVAASIERPLLEVVYPRAGEEPPLQRQGLAALATFAVQQALVELWRSWKIEPSVVLGHSVGEYAAAWAAGVMSLEDAAHLLVTRARMIAEIAVVGGMAAVHVEADRAARLLGDGIAIAALNGPRHVVISGPTEALDQALERLRGEGIKATRLPASHAFHSSVLDPILPDFEAVVAGVRLRPPRVRYLSGLSGVEAAAELCQPGYWRRQLREPVRFAEAVRTLGADPCDAYLEIGPDPVLLALAEPALRRYHQQDGPGAAPGASRVREPAFVASLARKRPASEQVARALAALYLTGTDVDWAALDDGRPRRRLALPTYPFERTRHWFTAAPAVAPAEQPQAAPSLLGQPVSTPLDHLVFETRLGTGSLPFLADHRVYDRVVVPAAAHLALALAAGRQVLGGARPRLEGVLFEEALVLEGQAETRVQTVLTPVGEGRFDFRIASEGGSGPGHWRRHATGRIGAAAAGEATAGPPAAALRGRLSETDPAAFYQQLEAVGIDLRPRFRGLVALACGAGEALGRIDPPPCPIAGEGDGIHPVLIDSCLQLFAAAVAGAAEGGEAYLPFGIERVEVHRPPAEGLWGHAVLGERKARDLLEGSVTLLREDGAPVMTATGVLARKAPRASLFRREAGVASQWEVAWRPAALVPAAAQAVGQAAWVLFADQGGRGEALAALLEAAGGRCLLVRPGPAPAGDPAEAASARGPLHIDPADPADHLAVLERAEASGLPLAGVVHLWPLDAGPGDRASGRELVEEQRRACESPLLLLRALERRPVAPRLTFVTQGACPAPAGAAPAGLAQAALWGLRRVVGLERPRLELKVVDLPEAGGPGAEALLAELTARDGEREVLYRGAERLVPRLTARPRPTPRSPAGGLSPGATYLVSGGLGALGLQVARWAVERGARSLLLVGRSPPGPAALAVLEELRARGAKVAAASADVADLDAVARLLATIPPEAPLRGVFHAAGVLDDALLENQSWQRFARVLAPKVAGAWNLHLLTAGTPLDCFVLFSSLASVLGSPAQANYAAANATLDALAHVRRRLGLPALSVNWGPWAEAGMAADGEAERRRAAQGVAPLAPAAALAALDELLAGASAQTTVAEIDWVRLAQVGGGAFSPAFLADVVPGTSGRTAAGPAARSGDLSARLEAAPAAERIGLLVALVRAEVAQVLGLEELSQEQVELSFTDLGMNSLMVVELRNRLEQGLGQDVPATGIFNYPTVAGLADYLGREVLKLEPAVRPAPEVGPAEGSAAAARIAALSEAEVEALLLETLHEISAQGGPGAEGRGRRPT